jgi:hypothetical protein
MRNNDLRVEAPLADQVKTILAKISDASDDTPQE